MKAFWDHIESLAICTRTVLPSVDKIMKHGVNSNIGTRTHLHSPPHLSFISLKQSRVVCNFFIASALVRQSVNALIYRLFPCHQRL